MDDPCLAGSVGELNSLIHVKLLVQHLSPSFTGWCRRGECFHGI